MNMIQQQDYTVPGEIQRSPNRIAGFFMHILLPIAALACGVAITIYLMKTSPEAMSGKRPPTATLVEVMKAESGPQKTVISAMGEIVAAQQIELKPRVNGEVARISDEFIPGGYFSAGQTMLRIDPTDYALVIQQLESETAKAGSDLALEMGYQRIAEKEFALLNEAVSNEEQRLILRKPQLEKLIAARSYAESKLAQARLDLERTEIKSPFNGVIESRMVDMGARVTESTVLAQLVGTDAFWLRLTLPVEQLRWVRIPASNGDIGSTVRIYTQGNTSPESYRTGDVIRLVASLENQGRMAQLLVRIDDPLCLREENKAKPRLLLGSYVRAEVEGIDIASGFSLDRANIHDGSNVWIMDDNGLLDIRTVNLTFSSRDRVIVGNGIQDGERIVTSALANPIAGIPLRLADDVAAASNSRMAAQDVAAGKDEGRMNRAE
jgi:RND family efflux transporter MFP subunit